MKTGKLLVLFFMILIGFQLTAAEPDDETLKQEEIRTTETSQKKPKTPSFRGLVGITLMPAAFWGSGQFVRPTGYSGGLNFDLDPNAFTTYEGGFWHKSGFQLGVSADVDNNIVGKLDKLIGFLGFKNFMLRVSGGKITGTAT
ncbi:hypothetical protein K7I13_13950 [Brucepastera parasyntrophica]|uniref:hypothetical protein n=1 Tax=Brucepastera parasyntrophica TaxID=2880008 RepID=UPI002108F49D|nr:hypothetical protein [Brucepastera parasyntrophica]ULQ59550.1 hypothetical protein K7I13_13950 [Brucepastera parasyntrophica]